MEAMREIFALALMALGAFLLLTAGIGVLRLPDTFLRMSASSKASSLGAGCVLLAVAVSTREAGVAMRALAAIAFLVLTTPVASHMIGRAAYLAGTPLWKGTLVDELRGRYDRRARVLRAPERESQPTDRASG
jgi:multicomponent Na+:H+ antiporter subunit G